jgi:hypothetical protein
MFPALARRAFDYLIGSPTHPESKFSNSLTQNFSFGRPPDYLSPLELERVPLRARDHSGCPTAGVANALCSTVAEFAPER